MGRRRRRVGGRGRGRRDRAGDVPDHRDRLPVPAAHARHPRASSTFAGTVVHTAKWDDAADLDGKRVAIIGTGATAVQLIPELARRAAHLTVFQRTPIWVTPKIDFEIPALGTPRSSPPLPLTQRARPAVNTALLELIMVAAVLHYRRANLLNRGAAAAARRHLRKQVADPELRREADARLLVRLQAADVLQRLLPRLHPSPHVDLETTGDRADHADRHRHRRRPRDRDRRARAGHRLRHVGRQLPGDPGRRPRRQGPRPLVARDPVPGLRGHRGPRLPQLPQPRVAVLLLGPVLLHDHRGPDEAHGPAARRGTASRRVHASRCATRPTTSSSAG